MSKTTIGGILMVIGVILAIITAFSYSDNSGYISYQVQQAKQLGLDDSAIGYEVSFLKRSIYTGTIMEMLTSIGLILAGYGLIQKR